MRSHRLRLEAAQRQLDTLCSEVAVLKENVASLESETRITQLNLSNSLDLIHQNSAASIAHINDIALDLQNRIATETDTLLKTLLDQRVALGTRIEEASTHAHRKGLSMPDPNYSYEKSLAYLRQSAPENFDEYMRCFQVGAASYEDLPPQSCSTPLHKEAVLFAKFLTPYLKGRILDIGCGPQSVPSYLASYPMDLLAGIDPLPPAEDHPFMFVQGFAELLPWPDSSFETIVYGTTIDHYYLLDRGISEAWRVLSPGGTVCVWITEFDDATLVDPYKPGLKSYDSEHLYHINRNWFLPFMEQNGFTHLETFAFKVPFSYIFSAFAKRS